MAKRQSETIFDHLYMETGRIGDPCVYCGQPSDSHDHVPPLHYVMRVKQADADAIRLRKHPACRECNSILGGAIILTLQERRKHVKAHLRKKYKSYLRMPFWDEDELSQMEPRFAEQIRRSARYSEFIKARIAFRT
jgi:hypothetical protein